MEDRAIGKKIFLLIKEVFSISPNLIFITILEALCKVCSIYIPLLVLPQILVSLYDNNAIQLILYGAVYFISIEIFDFLAQWFNGKRDVISKYVNGKLIKDIFLKPLKLSFEDTLENDFRNRYNRALDEITYECDYNDIISKLQDIITSIIDCIIAFIILFFMIMAKPKVGSSIFRLFASPAVSGILCIGIIFVAVFSNCYIAKKVNIKQKKYFDNHATIERKLSYYVSQVVENFKDYGIYHIYNMNDFLGDKIIENSNENVGFFKKARDLGMIKNISNGAVVGMLTVCAYMIVGIKILTQSFSAKMLFTYTYSIINFTNAILKFFDCWQYIVRQLPYFNDLSDFLGKVEEYKPLSCNDVLEEKECTWELIDVSYKYPEQTVNSISNLSLKIQGNKRHALVGRNGAGKSTLVLLLTGILKPTTGKILWNGKDISDLDIVEYRKYLSVVFQKFTMLPANIAQNVSCSIVYDEDKVIDCLNRAGFSPENKRYDLNTNIYNQGENGRIFSGGEMQKIAIARGLYKDSLCFIADEPTAALDPLSEAEIYKKMLGETKNNAVIFISHRMSSCKDCDDIIVMDNGSLVERGTHEELIVQKGIYNLLWSTQAMYYNQ